MRLSQDQETALQQIYSWYKTQNKQYITLGGYAGTGKTTLIAVFKKALTKAEEDIKVAFCSYTGKGALVLKNKLIELRTIEKTDTVGTIHSLIYEPVVNNNEEITGWKRKDDIKCDVIIVDEASMINHEIWLDLLVYKKPILAVGDHGQLPPITGNFNLMEKPEVTLTTVHRQAEENPIIKLSILARTKGEIPVDKYSSNVQKFSRTDPDINETINELLNDYDEETLILCGFNKTRTRINSQIRYNLGYETPGPEIGDRVICLRNNHDKQIFNGMRGVIEYIEEIDEDWYFAEINMESGPQYKGEIYKHQFNSPESLNYTKNRKKLGKGDIFDFGYALTVHKAQGSEANRVILFEERFGKMDDETWRRWLYTGVTRAKNELYIIG